MVGVPPCTIVLVACVVSLCLSHILQLLFLSLSLSLSHSHDGAAPPPPDASRSYCTLAEKNPGRYLHLLKGIQALHRAGVLDAHLPCSSQELGAKLVSELMEAKVCTAQWVSFC